jgi:CheY-like chemotaxis protein
VGKRVLIVEDDEDIRETLSEALEIEGYDVARAQDGADGLRSLRRVHPDVIVLDLMMPRMNGWEFREAQKRDPELAGIPVVVASAAHPRADIDADAYIEKPFELRRLVQVVEALAGLPT